MKKLFLLIQTFLLGVVLVSAQERSSATFGLDPSDEKALEMIHARMDSIRKHRPTVALVLSGGGAKGGAHVGALKYMEKFDLPIDMVVGTSVGGLLGGFYAMGHSVDYLDSLLHAIDWNLALSDRVDRQYLPYSKIRYKEKFILSFPFYYSKADFENLLEGDLSANDGRLHLSADEGDAGKTVSDNLLGSLPSGFVFGQNVNHEITSRTVGYSDSTDFFKFPIPFACVATDIVSGKAKVWHDGSVNMALRSTMSVPGLFAPVRTKGMVLVDGGMRNNFPVDIARDMGADIVIGIDLSDTSLGAGDIHNLADIVWQGIDMFAGDSFQRSVDMVDVHIRPDVTGYNMMSFNSEAIDTLMVRGYEAAKAKDRELSAIRRWVGGETFSRNGRPSIDISQTPVVIGSVEVLGVSPREADYIRSKMFVQPGRIVTRRVVEEDIARIFGKGTYDFVNYELRGETDPYRLRIVCKKGPMHRLGVAFRMDSEELVSFLMNVGLNTNAMRGSSLDMTMKVGANPYLDLHYAYELPQIPTLNARAFLRWTDRNNFISGTNRYNISYLQCSQEIFLSNMQWSSFDVKGGIRNDFFRVTRLLTNDVIGDYASGLRSMDYPSVFVNGRIETLDDGYFPTRGASVGIRYDLVSRLFDTSEYPDFFGVLAMDGKMPATVGERFTLIPQGAIRFIFGDEIPVPYANVVGGYMPGRYVDHQIPFIGIDNAAFRRNYIIMARLDARLRLGRNHYLNATGNYAYDFYTFNQFEYGEGFYGMGLGYAYNTIVGPIRGGIHWSSLTHRVGVYFSLGLDF